MKYTQAAGEKSTVKLTIDFSEQEWQDALTKSYAKVRGKYAVPGFRKGKVPRPVLENYYGKGVLYEEAFNIFYTQHYPEILQKERDNFTAVGEPSLEVEDMREGNGIVLSAVVPVKPDVQLDAYTGLKIKKYEYNVTDADVEKEVGSVLERAATDVDVTDRACKNGDTVNIDFSGSVDGAVFPGGTADGYDLVLGSGSFIPGFEDGVVGMNLNETRDIDVTFPADYQAENLKGKKAVFKVKLNKITGKQLPELTDELIKKQTGSETVEDYKKKTRERLERNAENKGRDDTENSIINELCKHAKAEIPEAMIENEIDRMVQDFSYRLMYQGLKLEDYLKYMRISMEEFRGQFRPQATPRVMGQLVIDKVIKSENIKVEEGELDKKIEEQAKSVDKSAEEYKKTMDPRQVEYISNDIVITKMFDFLKANNELYTEEDKPAAKKTASKSSSAKAAADKAEKPAAKKTVKKTEKTDGGKAE